MQISFIVNPIEINGGWSPWDTRIGGSEECIVEWARRLSKKHLVRVYHNGKHGTYGKVRYRSHDKYKPGDITINVNYPQFKPQGKTIYYTSLTENPNLDEFDAICCLSRYAKDNTGLSHRAVIVPPGYDSKKIIAGKKILKTCLYASSPDRGLDTLLRAWPQVNTAHPDAILIVTYGSGEEFASKEYSDGVIFLPEQNEEMMNELYRTSDIWCHPANGGELFCMTGKKAQISGCIPVIIPTMALNETVRRGFKVEDPKDYAKALIEVLDMPTEVRDIIRKDVVKNANALTWEESTDCLLEIINTVLSK